MAIHRQYLSGDYPVKWSFDVPADWTCYKKPPRSDAKKSEQLLDMWLGLEPATPGHPAEIDILASTILPSTSPADLLRLRVSRLRDRGYFVEPRGTVALPVPSHSQFSSSWYHEPKTELDGYRWIATSFICSNETTSVLVGMLMPWPIEASNMASHVFSSFKLVRSTLRTVNV